MAVNMYAPKQTKWRVWGGAGVAAIIVIAALVLGFDRFGTGAANDTAPATEQTAPATE